MTTSEIKLKITVDENTRKAGTIKLIPTEIELSTVQVTSTRDKEWEKKLKKLL